METTASLRQIVRQVLSGLPAGEREEAERKTCQRVFQAVRIDVNSEFEVLDAFLSKLPAVLKPGGRCRCVPGDCTGCDPAHRRGMFQEWACQAGQTAVGNTGLTRRRSRGIKVRQLHILEQKEGWVWPMEHIDEVSEEPGQRIAVTAVKDSRVQVAFQERMYRLGRAERIWQERRGRRQDPGGAPVISLCLRHLPQSRDAVSVPAHGCQPLSCR